MRLRSTRRITVHRGQRRRRNGSKAFLTTALSSSPPNFSIRLHVSVDRRRTTKRTQRWNCPNRRGWPGYFQASGSTHSAQFLNRSLIATIPGPAFGYPNSGAAINDNREVVYPPLGDNGFLLSNGTTLIAAGDLIDSHQLSVIAAPPALNDKGEIAFTAFFSDGTSGIVLATPKKLRIESLTNEIGMVPE